MSDKEKAPSTPEESNKKSDPILDPIWSVEATEKFAEEYFKKLEPKCESQLELDLAKIISWLTARNNQQAEGLNRACCVIAQQEERINHLEQGYSDLCQIHDQTKLNFLTISTRQGDHIKTCDKNFKQIVKEIKELKGLGF